MTGLVARRAGTATIWMALAGASLMSFGTAGAEETIVEIAPGPGAQERLAEALILAEPGQTIKLAEGVYELTEGLSLDADNVTVTGAGMDKTILSFRNQQGGAEGLLVTSDKVVLKDFAVEDTKGDAIKSNGSDGISFINLRTEWTGGPKESNGAYGLYPVSSKNVLIDGCVAIGASDAGIYVGQSERIIVRNSRAEFNVAGFEIENSYYADVYDNVATRNTGGLLIFDLPDLPQQGGHSVRAFRNKIYQNDTPNFAPEGNIVAGVPVGLGVMVMANSKVHVFENEIYDNQTVNVLIAAYRGSQETAEKLDPDYDPLPDDVFIYDNKLGRAGFAPQEGLYKDIADAVGGGQLPSIIWDGVVRYQGEEDVISKDVTIGIKDNSGNETVLNLGLGMAGTPVENARPSTDIGPFRIPIPAIEPVELTP